ncbi:hypothetical protein M0R45_004314 [Rubus argutus]|uniref:Uncharacterized protein n=1 Tax=Rubus argutus TaxID=59490 RepID=A0AAW1YJE4_RUBAR
MLIEQLSKGVEGTVVIEPRPQDDETEEDFKLRRFTELCKKIVDLRVQEKFLDNVERKLEMWGYGHFSGRSILEPQEYDRASELLSHLSTLGCSLLSAKYQQHYYFIKHKIEEMSNLVEGGLAIIEETTHDDDEEDFRMTRFTELFNQVPVPIRIDLFKELREILLQEKLYSEAVRFFRGLTDKIIKYSWEECDPAELIIDKFVPC